MKTFKHAMRRFVTAVFPNGLAISVPLVALALLGGSATAFFTDCRFGPKFRVLEPSEPAATVPAAKVIKMGDQTYQQIGMWEFTAGNNGNNGNQGQNGNQGNHGSKGM
jgi:hypothetical protein